MNAKVELEAPLSASAHELVMNRILNAPPARVFSLWQDRAHVARWWTPTGENGGPGDSTILDFDFRVGGLFRVAFKSPRSGDDMIIRCVYREIVPNEKLVFSFEWEKGMDMPIDMQVTVQFTPHGEKQTLLTFRHNGMPSESMCADHEKGWAAVFDNLARAVDALKA
ncbi:uncharacterized protein YndB with AHSA1/START domain [Silvimonas terrae]|uniref:Uncharacterized protein YndB with AHSA1/START domain n=1 Tax=Silvimonas terrae TaxID=300266 RepID=A0A840RFV0_9NEIS|nr:SRPBCC domain-containing protein [Silvimonas terrae]MBB5191398.1 uncharacterized protein YndB with AHSA1/START domain [Silvimonas terrae]